MKEKIYFIPGLMTDIRLWSKLFPLLEEKYELIHLDIPNTTDFDESIEVIQEQIKEENINLLGFSLGGYIASYLAIKNPKKVGKLFLVAATPSSTNEEHIEKRLKKLEYIEKKGFKSLGLEKAISLLEEQNQSNTELASILVDMFDDLGKDVFVTQLSSTLNRIKLEDEIMNLNIPITYFYSRDDRLLNHASIEYTSSKEHKINLVPRVGTSHNIPLEDPVGLQKEIELWMKQ